MDFATTTGTNVPNGALSPRGRLVVEAALLDDDARLLWGVPVAGLPLLARQILCLRHAGIVELELAAEPIHHETLRRALARLPASQHRGVAIVDGTQPIDATAPGTLILPANLVIDPRALRQLIQVSREHDQSAICVDRSERNYLASVKSPFVVGAPGGGDGRVVDASEVSPGNLRRLASPCTSRRLPDRRRPRPSFSTSAATRGTGCTAPPMSRKRRGRSCSAPSSPPTACTRRRIGGCPLRISRVLLPTPVTPNQVTLVALLCSGIAGAVMAGGTYFSFVVGGFLTWFASMLDGVDGELARARFQATALGHWLEMTCDYAFYLAVVSGYGVGFYRASGSRVWLHMAVAGLVGVVLSFLAVARDKRMYARWEPDGDYYLAFQRRTGAHASNPIYLFTRACNFLVSRGAFPYFIMAFAILGLSKLMFRHGVGGRTPGVDLDRCTRDA